MAKLGQIFFLAAFTRDSGLTSMSLGLVQALRRDRVAVGFIKPIMQPADRKCSICRTGLPQSLTLTRTSFPSRTKCSAADAHSGSLPPHGCPSCAMMNRYFRIFCWTSRNVLPRSAKTSLCVSPALFLPN